MMEAYFIHLLILILIYIILAISLQLAMGFTGLLNLGHIAFFCVGAYVSALLTLNGFPFWLSFLIAAISAMIFGFLLAIATSKLKGDYLALATLSFSFVIHALALNLSITGGPLGLPGIPRPELFGFTFSSNLSFLFLTIFITIISYFIIKRIVNSPFGKVLEAVRDDELAAETLGKNTMKIKSYALAISAFFAGIAGSLYAHYMNFIDPSNFTLFQLIPLLTIVIVAGLASLEGTIIATFIVILLPELLRFVGFPPSLVGPMRQIIYAIILLLILYYKPRGFYGKIELE